MSSQKARVYFTGTLEEVGRHSDGGALIYAMLAVITSKCTREKDPGARLFRELETDEHMLSLAKRVVEERERLLVRVPPAVHLPPPPSRPVASLAFLPPVVRFECDVNIEEDPRVALERAKNNFIEFCETAFEKHSNWEKYKKELSRYDLDYQVWNVRKEAFDKGRRALEEWNREYFAHLARYVVMVRPQWNRTRSAFYALVGVEAPDVVLLPHDGGYYCLTCARAARMLHELPPSTTVRLTYDDATHIYHFYVCVNQRRGSLWLQCIFKEIEV